MVSSLDELSGAKALCAEVEKELHRKSVAHDHELEIGIMIETPSSVWVADLLAERSQFFSVGTNDLIQYTLAIDRGNERLAALYEPLDPAVLRSIDHTIRAGQKAKRWVGVCGEMAGDPTIAVLLVGLGVDELSVSCFDLPRVKAAIRSVEYTHMKEIAKQALKQPTASAVRRLLHAKLESALPDQWMSRRNGP